MLTGVTNEMCVVSLVQYSSQDTRLEYWLLKIIGLFCKRAI